MNMTWPFRYTIAKRDPETRRKVVGGYEFYEANIISYGPFNRLKQFYDLKTQTSFAMKIFYIRDLCSDYQHLFEKNIKMSAYDRVMNEIKIVHYLRDYYDAHPDVARACVVPRDILVVLPRIHFNHETLPQPGAALEEVPFYKESKIYMIMDYHELRHVMRFSRVAEAPRTQYLNLRYEPLMPSSHILQHSENLVKCFVKDMTEAVAQIHSLNIVHRDIKPENLLISRQGKLLLTDFGIAEIIADGKLLLDSHGTYSFQAPEKIKLTESEPYLENKPADMWAIGVTMWVLLFGKLPFEGTGVLDLMDAIVEANIQWDKVAVDAISDECKHCLSSLLEVNVQSRLTAEKLKAHPWLQGVDYSHALNFAEEVVRYKPILDE